MQKIALVGCGMMGKVHFNAYSLLGKSGFELKYISDVIEERAEKLSETSAGVRVADFEDILDDEEITMLDICTPTYEHKDMVIAAAERGKNVFCEKPIALKIEDSYEMVKICKMNGVKLGIGHVTRYFPEYVKNLEIVKSGEIGKPVMARMYRGGVFPLRRPESDNWFNDVEKSGGVIVDLSIHDIDFSRQLFGEVKSIDARSAKLSYKNCPENFDHSMVLLRFKDGAIVHIEGAWSQPTAIPTGFKTSFEIYGTKGMVDYDSEKSTTFKLYTSVDSPEYSSMNVTGVNPYALEIESFIDALNNNKEIMPNGTEGLEALKIALAANLSAREQRTVYMKELSFND